MIIDCHADYDHACQYELLDPTWQPLPMDGDYGNTWYADDQKGILRIYLVDSAGQPLLAYEHDPQTPLRDDQMCMEYKLENGVIVEATPPVCLAWREEKRPIRIVKKDAAR